jgi:Cysteine-rich secretory protein family
LIIREALVRFLSGILYFYFMKAIYTFLLAVLAYGAAYSQTGKTIYRDQPFIESMLKEHNIYRSELQLPALEWSASLASDALVWGRKLVKENKGQHDPQARILKEGENLWWGTADAFTYAQMIDAWASEKKDFVYANFPDCKARRSAVVGHYTQMIWRNTRSVGCALVGNGQTDFLICRYGPPGNVEGEKVY